MRSGSVGMLIGYLRYAGIAGGYWSRSVLSSADTAYYLDFNDSGVHPSFGPDLRFYGYSLRCLQE